MSGFYPSVPTDTTVVNQVPIGGIAAVLRSGDAYKAVGEVLKRADYPALSAAFPCNGSFYATQVNAQTATQHKSTAYGAGTIVSVGSNPSGTDQSTNICSVSKDNGKSFQNITLPATANWFAVEYGGSTPLFVAIGYSNVPVCATSPDGVNWTLRAQPPLAAIDIVWNGSVFVGVGAGANFCITSTDGIAWTVQSMPNTGNWTMVVWGAGKFLALTSDGTYAATSTDGITWTARTPPAQSIKSICFGNNLFVGIAYLAAGSLACTSADGISWNYYALPSQASASGVSIAFGNGVFVAYLVSATPVVLVSYDGVNWLWRSVTYTHAIAPNAMGYAPGVFICPSASGGATISLGLIYAENLTNSDYMYLSGTAGQFVRVK